ncbi:hypothetical protein OXX59_004074 [Metschnikowia pulcherrima]
MSNKGHLGAWFGLILPFTSVLSIHVNLAGKNSETVDFAIDLLNLLSNRFAVASSDSFASQWCFLKMLVRCL